MICNNIWTIHTCTYVCTHAQTKFSIEHTSVGFTHARPITQKSWECIKCNHTYVHVGHNHYKLATKDAGHSLSSVMECNHGIYFCLHL